MCIPYKLNTGEGEILRHRNVMANTAAGTTATLLAVALAATSSRSSRLHHLHTLPLEKQFDFVVSPTLGSKTGMGAEERDSDAIDLVLKGRTSIHVKMACEAIDCQNGDALASFCAMADYQVSNAHFVLYPALGQEPLTVRVA